MASPMVPVFAARQINFPQVGAAQFLVCFLYPVVYFIRNAFSDNARSRKPARIVVTGAGVVTPLGLGWKINAEGFRAGRTAFRPVSLFDASRQRVKTAAEMDLPPAFPANRA